MLFYVIMTFVVLAIAGLICWVINDADGWWIDLDEREEWKDEEDDSTDHL